MVAHKTDQGSEMPIRLMETVFSTIVCVLEAFFPRAVQLSICLSCTELAVGMSCVMGYLSWRKNPLRLKQS